MLFAALSVASWASTLAIVVTYRMVAKGKPITPFHVANVVGAIVLGFVNARNGVEAIPQVLLNVTFGVVAAQALFTQRKARLL